MRPIFAVLACLCLLLAGCGAGAPGDDARTVNPALAGTPTASPTPETPARPPGVNGSGVDRRALVSAHENALEGRSLTVEASHRVVADNGTVILDSVRRSRTDGLTQFYRASVTETPYRQAGGRTFDISYWRNDTVTVRRWPHENGSVSVTLDTDLPAQQLFDRTGASTVEALLGGYELRYAGTTSRDGETTYVLTEANAEQPFRPLRSNVSLRALVTEEGVVRSITVSYQTTEYRTPARARAAFRVTNVSDTVVPRPPWVDEAIAEDE